MILANHTLDAAIAVHRDRFEQQLYTAIVDSLSALGDEVKNLDWHNIGCYINEEAQRRAA